MSGGGQLGGGGDWLRGGVATLMANANNSLVNPGTNFMDKYGAYIGNTAVPGFKGTSSQLNNQLGNTGQNIGQYSSSIPQEMQGYGRYSTPQLSQAQNQLYGAGMQLGQPMSIANQVFNVGGWTPQYQQNYGNLDSFIGQQTPGVQSSAGTANSLVGGMGQTDFNIQAQNMANNMLGMGGWTPQLSMALNPIQGIIGSAGNTSQSQALSQGASPLLANGGQTQLGNNMASRGTDLYSGQALMSPSQAASIARNQAATNNANQAKQAETQALARGGGAGATVANGLQNQGMADFYNQGNQNISSAVGNALQNQQGLNLTQQGQGINLAQGAGSLQNQLLGTSGGLMGQSGGLSNSLLSGALGEIPGLTNAAANYMSPYVNYGTGGMNNQVGMLGQGSQLAQMLESGGLGGINAMTNMMGNQNQYQLGMGGLQNSLAGTEGNIFNNLFGTGISQGQLGLSQFNDMTQAQQGALGLQNQFGNTLNNAMGSYLNPLLGLTQMGSGMVSSGIGGQEGMFGGMAATAGAQNPLLSGLIGAGSSLMGMI